METIECEGEVEFHSVTNVNCAHEGETSELDEQGGSNPSSKIINGGYNCTLFRKFHSGLVMV